jgi:putative transcriptional regulator
MIGKSNIELYSMSDNAILTNIGSFIKFHRLEQNKTQNQLAEKAGINRSTLLEFEAGNTGRVITLIQLLRSLNLLNVLENFQVKTQLSPIQLAKLDNEKRKRASKAKKATRKPKSDW